MSEVVRRAVPTDAAQLAELESLARHHLIDQRGGAALLAEQPAVGDWSVAIDDHSRWIGVAELDGFIVGYLELSITGDLAFVRQVYVQPEARELGFGDALLDAARSGIVLTAIQGRDYARIYVKDIERGTASVALSPEEQTAVERAMAR